MLRAIAIPLVVLTLALVPGTASAVTVAQVVALAKAGVTDAVILALIERDQTILTIEPEQLVALKRDGLSEEVIIAMLRSGRAEGEAAARAESAYRNAAIEATLALAPEVIIVGHGPDRPNTPHTDGFWRPYGLSPLFASPYALPYAAPYASPYGAPYAPVYDDLAVTAVPPSYPVPRIVPRADRRAESPAMCYAQMTSSPNRSSGLTYVTECPPVMQRAIRRTR